MGEDLAKSRQAADWSEVKQTLRMCFVRFSKAQRETKSRRSLSRQQFGRHTILARLALFQLAQALCRGNLQMRSSLRSSPHPAANPLLFRHGMYRTFPACLRTQRWWRTEEAPQAIRGQRLFTN